MKKLFLAIVICLASLFAANAQTPLNKQQTIEYIEKLFKSNWGTELLSVSLDGKIMVIKFTSVTLRKDLSTTKFLKVGQVDYGSKSFYISHTGDVVGSILWNIQLETDAIRLKKALEHLISLLKAEKSTDPFDN